MAGWIRVVLAMTVAGCSFRGASGDIDAGIGDDAIDAPGGNDAAIDGAGAPIDAPVVTIDASVDAAVLPCSTTGLVCPGSSPLLLACGADCWVGCTNGTPIMHAAAAAACITWGGVLAPIYDATENACVQTALNGAVWLGLVQLPDQSADDVGWSWNASGAPLPYINWDGGQPDDGGGGENNDENCAIQNSSGDWHDYPCSTTFARFACRRP